MSLNSSGKFSKRSLYVFYVRKFLSSGYKNRTQTYNPQLKKVDNRVNERKEAKNTACFLKKKFKFEFERKKKQIAPKFFQFKTNSWLKVFW